MKNRTTAQLYAMVFLLTGFLSIEAQIPGMPAISLKEKRNVFGGTSLDMANSITQTVDGGYAVAGFTYSNNGDVSGNHGSSDVWVIKFNSAGDVEWQKTLGGTGGDTAYSIIQTSDGGYAVAGDTTSNTGRDLLVIKLDGNGSIIWQRILGGTKPDMANSIIQTADGSYIVAGFTRSDDGDVSGHHGMNNTSDMWVLKLSSAGTMLWQKTLGGTGDDGANSIIQTADGGYVVAGYTYSSDGDISVYHGNGDVWIVRISAAGAIEWNKTLGGTDSDRANSVIRTADGNYIAAGNTQSNNGDVSGNHGDQDIWVVKFNAAGDLLWQKTVGGTGNDEANSLITAPDGSYAVAGLTFSTDGDISGNQGNGDILLVNLSDSGGITWQKTLGGTNGDEARSIAWTTEGGYAIAGSTSSADGDIAGPINGFFDFFILRFDAAGHVIRLYEDLQ